MSSWILIGLGWASSVRPAFVMSFRENGGGKIDDVDSLGAVGLGKNPHESRGGLTLLEARE